MLLEGKVVIVSGIGPGLGIKLAVEAALAGAAAVVCAARTPARLDAAQAAIRALGAATARCQVMKVATDITDEAQCARLAEQVVAQCGRIDVLLNSAFEHGRFEPVSSARLDGWRQAYETNVIGTLRLSQQVIGQMQRQTPQGGAIVMINTMATRKPYAGEAGYAASKGAQAVAVKYLAQEVGRHRIRVNSVFIGWMWGVPVQQGLRAMAEQQQTSVAALQAQIVANIPLGRMATDEECARAALLLASDHAQAITGACLDVNGGEYLP
ncbi:MAG TPA: SDR family oxidoreductase [Rubrivivax sp.]|jgi:NAD(P)-dependent dehydrogenase (short-subunit alcohol dehydrogenase family)|nr:SDR family oxidoreductase [Pseudomonadota bacterium]HOM13984.1 SDR family oxidoreductase [Rubrivivax sp.]